MHDAVVVKVCDGREDCPNEIGSIGFKIGAFAAYSVEKFTSKRKIRYKIDWRRYEQRPRGSGAKETLRLFIVSK
jgi:hypothetical protein